MEDKENAISIFSNNGLWKKPSNAMSPLKNHKVSSNKKNATIKEITLPRSPVIRFLNIRSNIKSIVKTTNKTKAKRTGAIPMLSPVRGV